VSAICSHSPQSSHGKWGENELGVADRALAPIFVGESKQSLPGKIGLQITNIGLFFSLFTFFLLEFTFYKRIHIKFSK
jgi:hypothetical protein